MFFLIIFIGIVIILLNNHAFTYWKRKGFVQLQPEFLFGDVKDIVTLKKHLSKGIDDLYLRSKQHAIVGIYLMYKKVILVNDPELMHNILTRDFEYFTDRGLFVDEIHDPLSGNLFSLAGEKWKIIRTKLLPMFSAMKLKEMFPIVQETGDKLQEFIEKSVNSGDDLIEVRDLIARFTTDYVASVGYGIHNDSINEPKNEFREMGRKLMNFKSSFRFVFAFVTPTLNRFLRIKFVSAEIEKFMVSIVEETLQYRQTNNIHRKDFIQLLLELKDDSTEVEIDSQQERNKIKLSCKEISSQVFTFYLAGFETTSSVISYCLYELAKNHEVQRKAYHEIKKVTKYDGINYDSINNMKYLDFCVAETLRKYPPLPVLNRRCTKDYKVPNTNQTILKGTSLLLPFYSIHRDQDYFKDPLEFQPERFLNNSNGSKIAGHFYYPFGDGPRMCIAMRLGKMSAKLGLSMILSKYHIDLTTQSNDELKFNSKLFFINPIKPLILRFKRRSNKDTFLHE
ncbi:unnamed protein product [Diamesa serratosioi]